MAWPIFGRDGPDVAWRPDPDTALHGRLARFLRGTGHEDLTGLQRHARPTRPGSGEPRPTTSALDWQRRPRARCSTCPAGVEWARWWGGGAFNYAAAAVDGRAARDPDGAALVWEGEDGEVRRLTNAELEGAGRPGGRDARAPRRRAPGDRVGIFLPMLPETVVAVLALGQAAGDLHARSSPATARRRSPRRLRRLRGVAADHRRRLPAAWRDRAASSEAADAAVAAPPVGARGARRPPARGAPARESRALDAPVAIAGGTRRWPTRDVAPLARGARRRTPRRPT